MFLKRKQRGKIKGKGCVDGRLQQEYITKRVPFVNPTCKM